ncbi:MAG: hypothetical protein EBR82_17780 [Caulobacteraceae bacterium]|nr:hypothetical protein [Caulobacteraceae bacterium]
MRRQSGADSSGGAAMTDETSAAPDKVAELWDLWRALKRHFPAWSLLPSGLYTPGAWGYIGVDFISGFRRNKSTRQTFDLLDGVDDKTFDALYALAGLNGRRQDQMLKAVVIGYLTLPLSIIAIIADIEGDSVSAFIREHSTTVYQIIAMVTLGPLTFLMSQWRSRQMIGVLDLIRIERGRPVPTPSGTGDE